MKGIRKLFQKILSVTLLPVLKIYLAKPRNYNYQGIRLVISPGVFHPRFFFSTQFLFKYIQTISVKDASFLELGAGSAFISFYANKQGAKVTASDINASAVKNILHNQKINQQVFEVIESDLFQKFPFGQFDIIAINPPYYKKNPVSEADYAWYCGENLEYFECLFSSLQTFIHAQSQVLMVLSEDCSLDEIKQIAAKNNFRFTERKNKRIWLERNYIFEINQV